ncbi:transposase [Microbacterium sp. EF45047]|nr:transposase [Microbacterium neungamense]WCM56808.1 transposase [Microbacterium sp. EF45047]
MRRTPHASAEQANDDRRLRVGSLFSGYGGLDLAVEEVFNAHTVWFSEINEPVARVFAQHWPDAPNLGDITTIDWSSAEPVDIICGKMAGLTPGTRSGLWAHMATAIDALHPEWVVIENVRGLLSAQAVIPDKRDQIAARKRRGSRGGRPPGFDGDAYRGRNVIERFFALAKQWRGIATRFDKLAITYRAGVTLCAILTWVRLLGDTP